MCASLIVVMIIERTKIIIAEYINISIGALIGVRVDSMIQPKKNVIKNEDTYCKVQHKIVRELGAWEAVVYGTIADILRKKDGYGNVSNDTLISLIGRDKKSIYRWIDRLVNAGYLEKVSGDGRGNISIYYVTKKGGEMPPFKEEKGGQIDTKRVANMTEKGGEMPPINTGINKEIKESDGVLRETQSPTLSNTTPQIFKNMENFIKEDFECFWMLYPGDPNWQMEKENCERVWFAMSQEWRDRLIQQLRDGKRWRVRENDNPYWYLRNYNGEVVKSELPYMRQGTTAFEKWCNSNKAAGVRMCLLHFEEHVAYCLYSDLQIMVDAGANVLNDNWK